VGAGRAQEMGYTSVFVMPDGIAGWERAKQPTETA
jgi:rhodanese-related sulfurtransferase